MYITFTWQSCN